MPTLDWIGKKAVIDYHNKIPYHLLRYNEEFSIGNNGQNLIIQGDNLLALKALLPYYAGKIKCIYIDPPYNTGNENWIYNDNVNSKEIKEWLGKVVGKESEDLTRHDKWLCMMYPRLMLLRELLSEDGIIFVSIDENEHRYLRLVMDEIFGLNNHVETLIWQKSYGGGSKSKHVVNMHEYILCFAKKYDRLKPLELPPDESVLKYYKFTDDKFLQRGPYRLQPLATNSMDDRPNLRYPIPYKDEEIWPGKQWQWSKERALKALEEDNLVIKKSKGNWTVSYKQYLKDENGDTRKRKPSSIIEGIYTQRGTNEIKEMFGDGKYFNFPKPKDLIKHLIQMSSSESDIILDCFAGSGTTAHAVLSLNEEDKGKRNFILVEMDENIAKNVTSERVRKVIKGYEVEKRGGKKEYVVGTGGEFRYLELDEAIFDENGNIRSNVSYAELAHHVYFTETGHLLDKTVTEDLPLLGVENGIAVYLLYGKDSTETVLTRSLLNTLPKSDGPKIIYGNSCRIGVERLKDEQIIFKQIPYEVRVS